MSGEKIIYWVRVALALILALVGLTAMARMGGAAGLAILVPCAIVAGVLASGVMSGTIANSLANSLFMPDKGAAPKKEYYGIRSLISKGQYDEAITEMEMILNVEPRNYTVLNMLADLYIDELAEHQKAYDLLAEHLKNNLRCPEDFPVVMKLFDLYLTLDAEREALALLENEQDFKYKAGDIILLKQRLKALRQQLGERV